MGELSSARKRLSDARNSKEQNLRRFAGWFDTVVPGNRRGTFVSPALDLRLLLSHLPSGPIAFVACCRRTARRLYPVYIDLLRIRCCTLDWSEDQRAVA